jgi:phosphatidate cytidylyltransferase
MLKQRVITALVLVTVFLAALFLLSDGAFVLFLALVAGACAWEWSALAGIKKMPSRITYVVLSLGLMGLMTPLLSNPLVFSYIMLGSMLWWIVISLILYLQPKATLSSTGQSVFYLLAGPLTYVPALLAAHFLRNQQSGSPWLLLLALGLCWAMDIGAYFSGKRWGKTKLAPLISPGKTIEGAVGGLAAVMLLWVFAIAVQSVDQPSASTLFLAVLIAGVLSVVGDLFESRAKRMVGMKDSGTLLPGHGGVLDRLDSAFAALPLFAFALLWL